MKNTNGVEQDEKKAKPFLLKALGVGLIIVIPLAATILLMTPLISRQKKNNALTKHAILANLSREQVASLIDGMRSQDEFKFYFTVLSPQNLPSIAGDVYERLVQNQKPEALLGLIKKSQERVKSLGLLFGSLEFGDEDFYEGDVDPELAKSMWLFLNEEFQLTILGIYYQANYDPQFRFIWDGAMQKAAADLQMIIINLNEEQKARLMALFASF